MHPANPPRRPRGRPPGSKNRTPPSIRTYVTVYEAQHQRPDQPGLWRAAFPTFAEAAAFTANLPDPTWIAVGVVPVIMPADEAAIALGTHQDDDDPLQEHPPIPGAVYTDIPGQPTHVHRPPGAPVVAQDERNPEDTTMTISLDLNTPQGITTLRAALGMTREQFAAALRCSPETLRKWETGRTSPLRVYLDRMRELAREIAR